MRLSCRPGNVFNKNYKVVKNSHIAEESGSTFWVNVRDRSGLTLLTQGFTLLGGTFLGKRWKDAKLRNEVYALTKRVGRSCSGENVVDAPRIKN